MTARHDTVIVGAGQAGLSLSHELTRAGREHVVLERGRVAESWRGRWDSFCLVLPNWTIRLAGRAYIGSEPDGFLPRDEIVGYLSDYAASFGAPVIEGVSVAAVSKAGDAFVLATSGGEVRAAQLVIATGGYRTTRAPEAVSALAATGLVVVAAADYRSPADLPDGRVLVIGSGQTGCQLAEELRETGREVWLACGRAPWQPRRAAGRDTFAWMAGTRIAQHTVADLQHPAQRMAAHPQMSGRDGGHDLHYRTLQAAGVVLTGHLTGVEDGRVHFGPDLDEIVAFGDARYRESGRLLRQHAAEIGLPEPDWPEPEPFAAEAPLAARVCDFAAVVVAAGYRPAWADVARFPEAYDELGFPIQVDGSSTRVPGLHFMGVPFQRYRFSSSLMGVGEDAQVLAERMAAKVGVGV